MFAPAPIDFAIGTPRVRKLAADADFAVVRPFTIEGESPETTLSEAAELRPERGPVLEILSLMAPAFSDDLASAGGLVARALELSSPPDLDLGRVEAGPLEDVGPQGHGLVENGGQHVHAREHALTS